MRWLFRISGFLLAASAGTAALVATLVATECTARADDGDGVTVAEPQRAGPAAPSRADMTIDLGSAHVPVDLRGRAVAARARQPRLPPRQARAPSHVGFLYTRRGGFIDLGHTRDNADIAAYLSLALASPRCAAAKASSTSGPREPTGASAWCARCRKRSWRETSDRLADPHRVPDVHLDRAGAVLRSDQVRRRGGGVLVVHAGRPVLEPARRTPGHRRAGERRCPTITRWTSRSGRRSSSLGAVSQGGDAARVADRLAGRWWSPDLRLARARDRHPPRLRHRSGSSRRPSPRRT